MKILNVPILLVLVYTCARAQDVRLELNSLRTQYENAVDRQVSPLKTRYLANLKLLKERYSKAGDLDSALLVDKELKSEAATLDGPSGKPPENEGDMRDLLLKTTWIQLGTTNVKYEFTPEGKIQVGGKLMAYYQVTGKRKVTMYWGGKIGAGGIDCLVSEDCLAIAEQSGGRNVWTQAPSTR